MIDLLPCPFCGCVPELIKPPFHGDEINTQVFWDIACGTIGCYLENGADWLCGQAEIVAMWNKRVNPIP